MVAVKQVKRLYSEFKPERYEVFLEPNAEKKIFSGRVIITGRKTGRPSQRITLHQKSLKITKVEILKLNKSGDEPQELDRINTHGSYDEIRLHTKQPIHSGQYKIIIEFNGRITEPMHGIYPCNFELDGQKRQLIATQFESHHAREVFPCIDEPEAKAVFSLSLKTPAGQTVISNTPSLSVENSGPTKLTVFEDTPKMSTYLLAFVYGDLSFSEAKTTNDTDVRVYSTPDKADLTAFALETAVRCLEFFEDYFGIAYPLPKLDMIGLPDFSSGAMENWGLITFREQVLYVDPKTTGIDTRQFVAMVVCHEIAHQWFGNLVTMKWWNDLWLNESFANLMEYRAVDELFPEWKIWEEFTTREMGQALYRDALPTVQAVQTAVNHPDELSSLFDPSIVYAKGGALLNMVRHLVGEAAFRSGLKAYFEQFKYSNTTADDLWTHLEKTSGYKIGSIMQNWLSRSGFPLLNINHQPGDTKIEISQQRLVIGESGKITKTIWQVPLAASQTLDNPMLTRPSQTYQITQQTDSPLVFNHNARSYFAAHYSNPGHFEVILRAAKEQILGPIDRLLLVQGYSLMERAGLVQTVENLRLVEALAKDREPAVWSILGGILGGVRSLLDKDEVLQQKYDSFIRPLAAPLVAELGWRGKDGDSSQIQKFRAMALDLAAGAEDVKVIEHGLKLFAKFSKPADLASDIRSSVYFIAVRYGTKADFDKLLKLHKNLANAEEKEAVAFELTTTRDLAQIQRLSQILTSTDVRLQDTPTWFGLLMRNRFATETAWAWLKANWDWIEDKYGSDKSYDRFPRYAAMAFSYPEQLADYKSFFKSKSNLALERSILLGIEEIEGRITWRQKNQSAVVEWVSQLQ